MAEGSLPPPEVQGGAECTGFAQIGDLAADLVRRVAEANGYVLDSIALPERVPDIVGKAR